LFARKAADAEHTRGSNWRAIRFFGHFYCSPLSSGIARLTCYFSYTLLTNKQCVTRKCHSTRRDIKMSVFTIAKLIPNNQAPSMINEVCFSPDGKTFCATYEYNNEVRLYSARTNALLRTFKNPGAALNGPHGVLLTKKHLIVANKGTSPCQFCIFNLADDTGTPVFSYTTPYAHLAEGHSIALHGRCLVVTYCEGLGKEGAIVSYDYDDENGRIIGPMDKQERWFSAYGDVKGVSFNKAGDKVYVTSQSDLMPWGRKAIKRLKNLVSGGTRGGPSRNGIAVFSIDQRGRFSSKPLWEKIFRTYCRLENIHIQGNHALVTNPGGGVVYNFTTFEETDRLIARRRLSATISFFRTEQRYHLMDNSYW
jgi:WD40 repeat protein